MIENRPLAERMRPSKLSDYISQQHLVGEKGAIRYQIDNGILPSVIFWGPPGTGKTTLAYIIANESHRAFFSLSAISSGIKDVRDIIERSKKEQGLFTQKNPIIFIDEIHRFNKTQQDSLLEAVERGWVTLIGATTENPSFEVIPALLSRCQVYTLNPFSENDLRELLFRAIKTDSILQKKNIKIEETEALYRVSSGDGRKLLNTFELIINTFSKDEEIIITNEKVMQIVQKNTVLYDKTGEQHYDIISAFIKSIRGSDPNGAVYWLARMIEGGEDIKFIARRMLILASEDIGNANPMALVMANNTFQAVEVVGYPEARIILSQCAIFLASSPKSNASYKAINKAQQIVKQTGNLSVPIHLRNAPTALMKKLNYGKDYLYSHDYPFHFVFQDFLPDELEDTCFYDPCDNPKENGLRNYLKSLWGERYGY